MKAFVIEDTEFGPGHVVVHDGSPLRMLITKVVVGFAEVMWFQNLLGEHGVVHQVPVRDIYHTSELTLARDQAWLK